jgi:hypothetical protein
MVIRFSRFNRYCVYKEKNAARRFDYAVDNTYDKLTIWNAEAKWLFNADVCFEVVSL